MLGSDAYTAYTYVTVPALVYAVGAGGFFAEPFAVITYPIIYPLLGRLWSVTHRHGFVTVAEFVRARFGSRTLATTVALLGIGGTMPYIALQLIGLESVLKVMGIPGAWPLTAAFVALPLYTLVLGLLALLGFAALANGTRPVGGDRNTIIPAFFDQIFPPWCAGLAFAAIGIGALVPAAIMSIAAANLFTRSVYREFIRPHASSAEETRVGKLASLAVKLGAVLVILLVDPQFSVDLQLIGGVVVLQILPAVALGLYTAW